jgi:hypothetical protein
LSCEQLEATVDDSNQGILGWSIEKEKIPIGSILDDSETFALETFAPSNSVVCK